MWQVDFTPICFFVALHLVTNREGRQNAFLHKQTFFFCFKCGEDATLVLAFTQIHLVNVLFTCRNQ